MFPRANYQQTEKIRLRPAIFDKSSLMFGFCIAVILGVWWAIFTFLPTTSAERIDHACHPILLVGKGMSAPVRVVLGEDVAKEMMEGFVLGRNNCAFSVWEGTYGEEYRKQNGLPVNAPIDYQSFFVGAPAAPDPLPPLPATEFEPSKL